jgi:phosphoserine phosphatase
MATACVYPPREYRLLSVIGEGADPADYLAIASDHMDPVILSPGHAFELLVHHERNYDLILERARAVAAKLGARHDINILASDKHFFDDKEWRRKKLLVADMDSTIIAVECLDELADMAGLKPQIAAITERAMRGELEFDSALRERVAMLKGLKLEALQRTYDERVRLNPGAKSLLATMRAHGAHTLLVSGGFGFFTQRVAEAAGFHAAHGNTLLDDGVALTGEVGLPILGRAAKWDTLVDATRALGLSYEATMAVGDGANDISMIERAGLGVAYHAKPMVAKAAAAAIQHNDLTALLYLQGYSDAEIVAA